MEKGKITLGDRLSTAFIMLIASFATSIIVCCVIFFYAMAGNELITVQFTFVIHTTVAFTLFGFVAPDSSINTIAWIWRRLESLAKAAKENDLN